MITLIKSATFLVLFVLSSLSFCTAQDQKTGKEELMSELKRGQDLARQGNSAEASAVFKKLMSDYPENFEPVQFWLMLNMKRAPEGEVEAIGMLEELEKEFPLNRGIIFAKAFIEAEYGQNEKALVDFDRLTRLQPDSSVNYIGKGQVLYEMGRYQESFESFDRATSLNPKRFDVWGMKAGALAKLSRYDEAIVAATRGVDANQKYPVAFYNRACIYCLKGDRQNALADLEKAISMNPGFRENALKDEDFRNLYSDPDFIRLTSTTQGQPK